jgi:hypothetical protein
MKQALYDMTVGIMERTGASFEEASAQVGAMAGYQLVEGLESSTEGAGVGSESGGESEGANESSTTSPDS